MVSLFFASTIMPLKVSRLTYCPICHFPFICKTYQKFYLFVGRISVAFLEDIHQKFVKTYGRAIVLASAYAMNDEFSRILSQEMDHFSNDPNNDKFNCLKGVIMYIHLCF